MAQTPRWLLSAQSPDTLRSPQPTGRPQALGELTLCGPCQAAHHHSLCPPTQRFQFVEVPGNHYVHMNQPHHVAGIISSFLQRQHSIPDMK